VVRGFLWTHHNSRIRNDHASRGELSERNVCFGFDYIRGIVHPYERKINSKSRCNRYLLYEFIAGCFLSLYFLYENKFTADFFVLSFNNWALMLILASICTAYFYGLRESDEKLSPYTVMLTTNLEPVYGIILAYFIIGGKRKMSLYVGAVIIIITVILNGIIKHKAGKKIVVITDDTITKDVR
jgi:hypothetical protein